MYPEPFYQEKLPKFFKILAKNKHKQAIINFFEDHLFSKIEIFTKLFLQIQAKFAKLAKINIREN